MHASKRPLWVGALLAAGALGAGGPALAQTTLDELTVTGRYGVGPEVRSLSAVVSYRDLDLTTAAGRDVLHQRVKDTARDLCTRLGESNAGPPLVPSCEQDAMNSAAQQERVAFTQAPAPEAQAYVPPAPPAPEASSYGAPAAATVTTRTITNGPVPDTPENRRAYGGPMSNGGRRTAPAGD